MSRSHRDRAREEGALRGAAGGFETSLAAAPVDVGRAADASHESDLGEVHVEGVGVGQGSVLSAGQEPYARLTATVLPQGATSTVVVSRSLDQAVFTASDLDSWPHGKVYQLRFDDRVTMRPAGLIDPHHTTTATLMDGPVAGATGMAITFEPACGSARPASPPVALAAFPAS
ncbi:anti-sigma factor [Streptomyces sp. NPDC088707]|uniref:anti-sigma factor n=1 Tax=Streptomyces sp. NPDC088707 TaxID=3365871 RepID=UPI0037F5E954